MDVRAYLRWWKPIARFVIGGVVLLSALFWTFNRFYASRRSASEIADARRHDRAGGHSTRRLWRVPPFRGLTQEGRPIDAAALAGNVWIIDFIYTRCTSACPLLTARMMLLARRLDPRVRLLSFSVDPGFDRPEVLAAYARRWPHPRLRWTLITPQADTLAPLARDMRILVERNPDDAADITHSSQFFLVDGEGWVRGIYDSQDEGALAALISDAAEVAGGGAVAVRESAAPGGRPGEDGRRLFLELGCDGCHADPRTAPPLGGFGARRVPLEDGSSVLTDRAYLRASLLAPWTQVVRGYSASMPSYAGTLNAAELDALLGYLESLPPPVSARASATAIDPVCHMKVAVVDTTPRLRRDGYTYYFCSDACRSRFDGDRSRVRSVAVPHTDDDDGR